MSLDWVQFINTAVVPVGLMLIMFSLGLTLALRDFALVARNPLLVGAGFGTHLFVLPLLGLAHRRAVPAAARNGARPVHHLDLPGRHHLQRADLRRPRQCRARRGADRSDQPGHRRHHSAAAELGGPLVPGAARRRQVPTLDAGNVIFQLVRITVIPILVGMLVRHFAPKLAARLARWLRPTAFVILVVVIAFSVIVSLEMVLDNLVAGDAGDPRA